MNKVIVTVVVLIVLVVIIVIVARNQDNLDVNLNPNSTTTNNLPNPIITPNGDTAATTSTSTIFDGDLDLNL